MKTVTAGQKRRYTYSENVDSRLGLRFFGGFFNLEIYENLNWPWDDLRRCFIYQEVECRVINSLLHQ